MEAESIEQIIREYIDKTVHLSLGTASNNNPWVCEVHFAYDSRLNLYFRSLPSRRHSQEIADNARVAGTIIDKYAAGEPVVGVYFEGTAAIIEPGDEQQAAAKYLRDRLKITTDIIADAANEDGHQFYKITVKHWYVFGAFNGQPGQKYLLDWSGDAK